MSKHMQTISSVQATLKKNVAAARSFLLIVGFIGIAVPLVALASINTKLYPNTSCTGSDQSSFSVNTDVCAKTTGLGNDHIYHIAIFSPSDAINPFTTSASGTGNRQVAFQPNACGTWTAKVIKNSDNSLADTQTFTVTGCPATAKLTLAKTVTNDNGGGAAATAWTLTATGPTSISGVTGNAAVTNASVNPGGYTLGETSGPTGYAAGTYSCMKNGGPAVVNNSITLAANDIATCTINNNDQPAHLTIIKHVITDNGGSAAAGDWTIDITGSSPSSNHFAGTEAPGTTVTINAGAYSVDESGGPAGYAKTLDAGCSGTLLPGGSASCTITNNDTGGTLIVKKETVGDVGTFGFSVTNQNQANAGLAPFNLTTTLQSNPAIQSFFDVFTDIYNIMENPVPEEWVATSAACDNQDAVNAVHVGLNQTVTCTFTNTKRGKIIVAKDTIPNSETSFHFNASYDQDGFDLADGQSNMSSWLVAGTYTITEDANPDYTSAGTCDDGSVLPNVTVSPAETVHCTFTNSIKQGGITIIKQTQPASDQSFDFTSTIDGDFSLSDGGSYAATELDPGEYSVSENTPPDWEVSIACEGSAQFSTLGNGVSITLGPDQNLSCVFTNTRHGHVVIHKITNNEDSETPFAITLAGGTMFGDATRNVVGGGYLDYEVAPSTYSANEAEISGWTIAANDCTGIAVGAGETKYCTVTNHKIPQCSDGKDNDDDGLTDVADPACHSDGNVNNQDSYNPNGNEESNNPSNQCADGKDNDQDGKIDSNDPGCHTDANPDNPQSYDATGTNETDPADACSNMQGIQRSVPEGLVASEGACVEPAPVPTPTPTPESTPASSGGEGGGGHGNGSLHAISVTPPAGNGQVLDASICNDEYLKEYMKFGRKNNPEEVKKLQTFLNENLGLNPPLAITGIYDAVTRDAVNQFQVKYWEEILAPWLPHGLATPHTPTGYVYKTTKRWINMLHCTDLQLPVPELP